MWYFRKKSVANMFFRATFFRCLPFLQQLLILILPPCASHVSRDHTHPPTPISPGVGRCGNFHGFPQSSQALSVAVNVDGGAQKEPAAPKGFVEGLKGLIPSKSERKKLIPLAGMFFCILFNYTILRDTKVGFSVWSE